MQQTQYIPGVCNIGKSEIKKRNTFGALGFIFTILIYILFVYQNVPNIFRLIIFIPVFITALGFLQAYMHFCVYYGIIGVFNFIHSDGKTDTIEQAEFRTKDKKKAWEIIFYSLIIAIIASILAYYYEL